jgi:DNA-binding CsgD family transcriptional regulator
MTSLQRNPNPAEPTSVKALAEIARLARLASAGTIPDAIRRCRRAAGTIDASTFALFFAGRGVGAARLVPCFDEAFPGSSGMTAALSIAGAEALSRHAVRSSIPATWHADASVQKGMGFLVTLAPILGEVQGIALPVATESGQTGLFVFTGKKLDLSGEAVLDLHQLCFDMFAAVAQLRSGSASSLSAISKRELECLKLTAAGRTSEDIARILGLSIHTANQYLTSAAAKLDAVNRTQAVAKAIRLGLID